MRRSALRALTASLVITGAGAMPAAAIVGGAPDDGAHPMVGLMVAQDEAGNPLWRCSGSLVSATGLVTAGHCTSDDAGGSVAHVEVFFDEDVDTDPEFRGALAAGDPTPCTRDDGSRIEGYPCTGDVSGQAYTHPEYDPADFALRDLGVVVLDEPWVVSQYAELPAPGAFDSWTSNQKRSFTVVGYGVAKQYGKGASGRVVVDNDRRVADTTLKAINKNKTGDHSFEVSNNKSGGTCGGDSGGPTFVEDGLVVAGVTSYSVSQNTCGGTGGAYRLDRAEDRPWLETALAGTLAT